MTDKKAGASTMSKTEYIVEAGKHDLVMTHTFDAPRDLVFKAYTDPTLFAQWWGPREYTNRMDKFDVRRGGRVASRPGRRRRPRARLSRGAP